MTFMRIPLLTQREVVGDHWHCGKGVGECNRHPSNPSSWNTKSMHRWGAGVGWILFVSSTRDTPCRIDSDAAGGIFHSEWSGVLFYIWQPPLVPRQNKVIVSQEPPGDNSVLSPGFGWLPITHWSPVVHCRVNRLRWYVRSDLCRPVIPFFEGMWSENDRFTNIMCIQILCEIDSQIIYILCVYKRYFVVYQNSFSEYTSSMQSVPSGVCIEGTQSILFFGNTKDGCRKPYSRCQPCCQRIPFCQTPSRCWLWMKI